MYLKDEILIYERKLLQIRKELNELSAKSYNNSDKLIQDKILFFESEIAHLNNQLSILRQNTLSTYNEVQSQISHPCEYNINSVPSQKITSFNDSVNNKNNLLNISKPISSHPPQFNGWKINKEKCSTKPNTSIDLENAFGKTGMAIFASILIFISLIMFAMVLAPRLTYTMKIIAMFVISFGITIFGYYFGKKQPKNRFFDALLGCGLSCVYISLFLSHIYFHKIDEVILYLLLVLWGVAITYISKIKSSVFYLIGHIGVTISLFFGTIRIITTSNITLMYAIDVFFVVAYILFMFSQYKLSLKKIFTSHICVVIDLLIMFYLGCIFGNILTMLLSVLVVMTHLIFILKPYEKAASTLYFCLLIAFTSLLFIYNVVFMIIDDIPTMILIIIINTYTTCRLIHFEFWGKDTIKSNGLRIIHLTTFIVMALSCVNNSWCIPTIILLVIFMFAYFSGEKIYQIVSSIGTIIYVLAISEYSFSLELLFVISILIVIIGCYFVLKRYYLKLSKVLLIISTYIALAKIICIAFDTIITSILLFPISIASISTIHFLMYSKYSIINWNTGENEKDMILFNNIINELLLLISIVCISIPSTAIIDTIIQIMFIAIAIALLIFNHKIILDANNKGLEIYLGLRYTISIMTILTSFIPISVILSVCCALLAFIIIIYGFKVNKQYLRVYGLVVANISVIKLMLFDISYNTTLQRAFSLFICGIICFSISYLYNKINKK